MDYVTYKNDFLEFLATPGILTKEREEIKLHGYNQPVYTSPTLKAKLKAKIKKSMPSYSVPIFHKLIEDGSLVPVFVTKNLWQFFKKRKELKFDPLGTYYSEMDKFFIFMEPIMKHQKGSFGIFMKSGGEFQNTLFHESMHMAAYRNTRKFWEMNKVPLLKFYSFIIFELFKIKGTDDQKKALIKISDWIQYLLRNIEVRRYYLDEKNLLKFLEDIRPLSSLDDKEYGDSWRIYRNALVAFDTDKILYSGGKPLILLMQKAYKKYFRYNVTIGWIAEELTTPSGVISKLASHNPNLPYVKKSLRLAV